MAGSRLRTLPSGSRKYVDQLPRVLVVELVDHSTLAVG